MKDLKSLIAKPGHKARAGQSYGDTAGFKPPVRDSEDLARVLALPRRQVDKATSLEINALINGRLAKPSESCDCVVRFDRPCITTLNETQTWGLYELGLKNGLFGAIGVGHGKTAMGILAPLVLRGCRLAVLLCPPGVLKQVIREYQLLQAHFRVPSIVVHGSGEVWEDSSPGRPTLHVIPYSLLSQARATVLLDSLKPDVIIADEAHKLRHAKTATTSRVTRYLRANPACRFAGWTGTPTDSSIKDYMHLLSWSLREFSPLPLNEEEGGQWAGAIDPSPRPAAPGALLKLCNDGEHYRSGVRRRLADSEGFVITTEASVTASLIIQKRSVETPAVIKQMLADLRLTWTRPDGEELVSALDVNRCALELGSGFYYRWIFPRGESEGQITAWLLARKKWNKELRQKLSARHEHMDSEKLCTNAAARYYGLPNPNSLPVWQSKYYPAWREIKDTVYFEQEAVRVDDFLARDAAYWGTKNLGVIWYDKVEFGDWVSEISGLPKYGGGEKALAALEKEKGKHSVILSIDSHGTGRDFLQRVFCNQLVANPPSSATGWEQFLGRLHRQGQKSDEVKAWYYCHTAEFRNAKDQALGRAEYVAETQGQKQKLLTSLAKETD